MPSEPKSPKIKDSIFRDMHQNSSCMDLKSNLNIVLEEPLKSFGDSKLMDPQVKTNESSIYSDNERVTSKVQSYIPEDLTLIKHSVEKQVCFKNK